MAENRVLEARVHFRREDGRLGISQEEAAAICGVDTHTFRRAEAGGSLRALTKARIAAGLNKTVAELWPEAEAAEASA